MSAPPWTPEEALDLCRAHVEGGQFSGLFLVGMPDGNAVIPCFETPQATAAMIGLQVMAGKMAHPNWIIFLADTYHFVSSRPVMPAESRQSLFEAGDPEVSEAVVAICVSPDGPSYEAIQLYTRDGDEVEWGDIVTTTTVAEMGGRVYDLMVAVMATPFGAVPDAADGMDMQRVPLP